VTERTNRSKPIRIGSRGSALARAQTGIVRDALAAAGIRSEVSIITTQGDLRPPNTAPGEGAFVGAIEAALLSGEIDLGVHSAKDLPTDATPGLEIVAYLPRAAAGDVLVLPAGASPISSLGEIRSGARIGTDSPRRTAFLRAVRPDLEFHPLSGNVDTRLRRLDEGRSDALVLAEAGLIRLGRRDRISLRLPPSVVPPAPGQGALAIQARASDVAMRSVAARVDDGSTRVAVELERDLLAATGGGCRAPIGAFARVHGLDVDVTVGFARPDAASAVILERRLDASSTIVQTLLAELIERGAEDAVARGGRSVVVTRPSDQAAPLALALLDRGIAPVVIPAIEIIDVDDPALDAAARRIDDFDWVVVTSANAAESLARALRRVRRAGSSGDLRPRFAAVGSATARALRGRGIHVTFRPIRSRGESLGENLPLASGERVLLPRSDLADERLIALLEGRGAEVEALVAYRTREAPRSSIPLLERALRGSPAMVVLASGSAARGLLTLTEELGQSARVREIPVACVGPETDRAAARLGFRVAAVADRPDARAVAGAVATALAEKSPPMPATVAGGAR